MPDSEDPRISEWLDELGSLTAGEAARRLEEIAAEASEASQVTVRRWHRQLELERADQRLVEIQQRFERDPAEWIGELIDRRYLIHQPLGAGGSSKVYLAVDQRMDDRPVAIKFLRHSGKLQAEQEKQALLLLQQAGDRFEGIVQIYDCGTFEGIDFLVLEHVQGVSLAERIRQGSIPWEETRRILQGVADAVEALHGRKIYHRDLKPANIILRDSDHHPVLIDFGIAHHATRTITQVLPGGTYWYMAPEAFAGKASSRSDVYSLARIGIEMLGVSNPAAPDDDQQLTAKLESCGVPARAIKAIEASLSLDPLSRPATAAELMAACRGDISRRRIVAGIIGTAAVAGSAVALRSLPSVVFRVELRSLDGAGDRFQLYLELERPLHLYVVAEGEPLDSRTRVWPPPGESSLLQVGGNLIPGTEWNAFNHVGNNREDTLWLVWSPEPLEPLERASAVYDATSAPSAWQNLLEHELKFTGTLRAGSSRSHLNIIGPASGSARIQVIWNQTDHRSS